MLHIPLLIGEKLFQVSNKKLYFYLILSIVFWELGRLQIMDDFFNIIASIIFSIFSAIIVYGAILDWNNMWKIFTKPYVENNLFSQKDIMRIWFIFFGLLSFEFLFGS